MKIDILKWTPKTGQQFKWDTVTRNGVNHDRYKKASAVGPKSSDAPTFSFFCVINQKYMVAKSCLTLEYLQDTMGPHIAKDFEIIAF